MKKVALAAAFSLAATSAFAGGLDEPEMEMEPEIIVEETGGGVAGWVVPLLLLVLLGAAVSASD